ncbi:MAG TPA: (deoxy)nucleoside triphosphate pyrophosphohydrolase [Candidatus Kapabacteria bacterium]|nr:(deoxy)nucleoside triphosphate pyrophosphohydrolase [Candidatus Kapabacteria bacterium]
MSAPIAVVVGLLSNSDGRILLCQRPAGKPYALQWEFPGGKVEPGESAAEALARELREELGIEAEIGPMLHNTTSRYTDGGLFAVAYYGVTQWNGAIANMGFADIQRVEPAMLTAFDILAGNVELCTMLARGEMVVGGA